jgi:hypothetical protein
MKLISRKCLSLHILPWRHGAIRAQNISATLLWEIRNSSQLVKWASLQVEYPTDFRKVLPFSSEFLTTGIEFEF